MQLVDHRVVARVAAVRIDGVNLGLEDFIIVIKVLVALLNGREELNITLHDCHNAFLALLLVVHYIAHHKKKSNGVLLFLRRRLLA